MSYELNFRPEPFQGTYELNEWEAFDSESDQDDSSRSSWTPLVRGKDIYAGQHLVPELTDKNYWNIFLDRNKVVVVDFWQDWCRPCDPVAKIMVDLAQRYRSSPFKGRVKFYHVRLEDKLNPKLYQSFPFSSVPTVYFYYTSSGRRPTRAAPLLEGSMQGENGFNVPKIHDPEAYIHRIDTILRRHGHLTKTRSSLPSKPTPELEFQEMEVRRPSGGVGRIRRHPGFGHIWSGRIAPVIKEVNELEIFPPDTRKPVLDTTKVPFRWICRLEIDFGPDPEDPEHNLLGVGTGTLISPRHVLTTGHNLFPNQGVGAGTLAKSIKVIPGYNCAAKTTNSPFGSTTAAHITPHPKWTDSQDKAFDFGIITLNSAIGSKIHKVLGDRPLGFWGSKDNGADTRINPAEPAKLKKIDGRAAGYPTDKCCFKKLEPDGSCRFQSFAGAQFVAVGKIVQVAPVGGEAFLLHRIDVFRGNSGSPIWVHWEKFRNLVGLHVGELTSDTGASINAGLRVTDDFLKEMKTLMK